VINKGSELHLQGEFLHNYHMLESVHDGDHDCVVSIVVGLSCKLRGYFFNVTLHHQLHYIMWNNFFFPTRSVMINQRTVYAGVQALILLLVVLVRCSLQ